MRNWGWEILRKRGWEQSYGSENNEDKNKCNVNLRHLTIRNRIYSPYSEVASVVLNTHFLLVPGCEWVRAIPAPPLCVCFGVSCVDLSYYEGASIERWIWRPVLKNTAMYALNGILPFSCYRFASGIHTLFYLRFSKPFSWIIDSFEDLTVEGSGLIVEHTQRREVLCN